MTRWPWITSLASVALAASPWGRALLFDAFVSGEQLSRNIAQPLAGAAMAVMAIAIFAEWLFRRRLVRGS